MPETLVEPIEQLAREYMAVRVDAAFQKRLRELLINYVGRPTPLYEADPSGGGGRRRSHLFET